jgi:hypothetical protein
MSSRRFVVLFGLMIAAIFGCNGPSNELDTKHLESATQDAYKIREIFDKAKGDYSALSPEDKAEFVRLAGDDEAAATRRWEYMKNPPPRGGIIVSQPDSKK